MCCLFPSIYDVLSKKEGGKDFQVAAFFTIVEELKNSHFNNTFDLKKVEKSQHFQDKTSIVRLATKLGKELVEQHEDREEDILV